MTGIAVVASAQDAKFAEDVRAGLQAAGLDASVSQSLPKAAGPHVVLIWSAALEEVRAVDAQALIGLWSEDRLLVARRDATPLPLGLRDLPSMSPGRTAADVCAAVPGVRQAAAGGDLGATIGAMADLEGSVAPAGSAGSQDVEVEFWRAIKDGNDPDDFELYVQQFPDGKYVALAKRKIEKLRGKGPVDTDVANLEMREVEAEKPRAKTSVVLIFATLVAIMLMGGGAWYYFNKSSIEKRAALTAALETATKASQELQQAQAKQLESLKALEQARAAEEATRASGDAVKLNEALDATKRAEAEANKQADLVKQREVAAADARKKATEAAENAKKMAKAPEKAPEPVAKAEAPKKTEVAAAAPKAEAKSAPVPMSRSERERIADEEAAHKAIATAKSAKSSAPEVAASAPSAKGPGDEHKTLYEQALALEQDGKAAEAVRIYRRAARAGSGKAAKRLGEIYDRGVAGVSRDYAESLQWYEVARQLGERVETAGRRESGPSSTPGPVMFPPEIPAKSAPPPAPAPAPAPVPEPTKAADPAPAPAAQAPEAKSGWLSVRGWLIALLVLGFIYWRRKRRRAKAMVRQSQPRSRQQSEDVSTLGAARSVYEPRKVAPSGDAALFVSYSHKDRSRVEPIVSVIEEMGRRVWMDRNDITGQTGWAGQIVRAIRECRAVVLMASPNSYTSDQVVRELYLAMNHRKTIVPIEIEPAEMPDELQYILAPFQHHRLSGHETREVIGRALAAV